MLRHLEELASLDEPLHLALGVFDGVHLGHRAVIAAAVEAAKREAQIEADRGQAIAQAVAAAGARDVLLIAGKGHEDYQEVMGVKSPFSDLEQAQLALAKRMAAGGAA